MSQFRLKINRSEYMYGYDRPLQSFFFSKLDLDSEDEDNDSCFSVASSEYMTIKPHPKYPDKMSYSNGEMMELVNEEMGENAPDNFMLALAMDLPL
jgi:hypothetical protein